MNHMMKTGLTVVLGTMLFGSMGAPIVANAASKTIYGTKVPLKGASNVQDMGGIKTKNGHRIKAHRIIRSNKMINYTKNDVKVIKSTYKLKTVVDFRSGNEIKNTPDVKITNVKYIKDGVVKDSNFGGNSQAEFAQQLATMDPNHMPEFYQGLVSDKISIKGYKVFFNQLLKQKQGATLFHCTDGKDRTGIGAMLFLSAMGVSKQTIMKEYLRSNHNLAKENKIAISAMDKVTTNKNARANFRRLKAVKKSYLNAAYKTIDKKYGSVDNFLKTQIGLNAHKKAQLRAMYLTK
ncbi:tyrosine-protein phosphatase [Levilactobacillus andaensis]|uniref:tyrosine-protein phosphatase n=1 Tax=Levilactobacillus andaensis TaxID=2799570 RepID=UPI001942EF4F|nr:tyrosine-protein phosphatase [Levilactobacillus andaensis]